MRALKRIFKDFGNRTAYNSVSKSIKLLVYEPRMPQTLKKQNDVNKGEKK